MIIYSSVINGMDNFGNFKDNNSKMQMPVDENNNKQNLSSNLNILIKMFNSIKNISFEYDTIGGTNLINN